MKKQSDEQAASQDVNSEEDAHILNEIYHKLDNEQDKLIKHWINWSRSKVIGELTLSVIYCIVALIFILLFAFSSFLDQQVAHAKVLLLFSLMTVSNLIGLLTMKNERVSNALIVVLLGGLCLYLFISGGVDNTGPLWYFVYPIVALFILNLWEGIFMTVILFWATMMVYSYQVINLDYSLYSGSFITRFFAVYIAIAIMSFLYAYNRSKNDLMHRE